MAALIGLLLPLLAKLAPKLLTSLVEQGMKLIGDILEKRNLKKEVADEIEIASLRMANMALVWKERAARRADGGADLGLRPDAGKIGV